MAISGSSPVQLHVYKPKIIAEDVLWTGSDAFKSGTSPAKVTDPQPSISISHVSGIGFQHENIFQLVFFGPYGRLHCLWCSNLIRESLLRDAPAPAAFCPVTHVLGTPNSRQYFRFVHSRACHDRINPTVSPHNTPGFLAEMFHTYIIHLSAFQGLRGAAAKIPDGCSAALPRRHGG